MANQRAVNGGGRGRGRRRRERNAADADASVSSAFLNSHATNRTRIVPGVIGFMRLVTNSVTLNPVPSFPHSPFPSPATFSLLSMPTKLELIIIIIIGISVKCDLNLIILNYFVTCISFSFSISFSFPFFFLDLMYSGMLRFSFCLSFSSHAMCLIPFGFVTFPVRFRFRFDFDSFLLCLCFLCFFFFIFYWFTRVDSVLTEPLSLSPGRLHLFDWNWFLVSRWGFETRLKNHNNHNHIVWHCIVLCSILVIFSSAQLDLRLKC